MTRTKDLPNALQRPAACGPHNLPPAAKQHTKAQATTAASQRPSLGQLDYDAAALAGTSEVIRAFCH